MKKDRSVKKASENPDYDNFGYHWYPKQTSSSRGSSFGLAIMGLGILLLIIQVIFYDAWGILFSLILIIGGWFLAGHFAKNIENDRKRMK